MERSDRCKCDPGFAADANGDCWCIPGTSHCNDCGGPNTRMDHGGSSAYARMATKAIPLLWRDVWTLMNALVVPIVVRSRRSSGVFRVNGCPTNAATLWDRTVRRVW
jgi:hypothetical protein